jgi:hypothetical protein
MAGQFITFCRNVSPVNEQKVEIFICCSIEYFQPELLPNNEQKAHEMHVCPAIANALVIGIFKICPPSKPQKSFFLSNSEPGNIQNFCSGNFFCPTEIKTQKR